MYVHFDAGVRARFQHGATLHQYIMRRTTLPKTKTLFLAQTAARRPLKFDRGEQCITLQVKQRPTRLDQFTLGIE